MVGLVIKSPWIDLILEGRKTWEIRGSNTHRRGRIALIRSGSGSILGTCRVVDCIGPLSPEDMKANVDKHHVPLAELERGPCYPATYAWVLADALAQTEPLPYQHPSGAVIWVRLSDQNVAGGISRLSDVAGDEVLQLRDELGRTLAEIKSPTGSSSPSSRGRDGAT